METMRSKAYLVTLVAIFALLVSFASVSAFADITSVEVDGVEGLGTDLAVVAGDTVSVRVVFEATGDADDVTVEADVSGIGGADDSTERFNVKAGSTYVKHLTIQFPFDIDPTENFTLEVEIEGENEGVVDSEELSLSVERESYIVEILDVITDPQVVAGDSLALDIVLKNRGQEFAEDAFVEVRIPSLGVSDRAYFGDLAPVDQDDPDKEDAVERRMFVGIPSGSPAGVYVIEVEASTDDSSTTVTKQVAIVGASESTIVVAPSHSQTLNVGEEGEFSVTLVNSGDQVGVYELVLETTSGLTLELEEPVVAVPAGTSKTVRVFASADESGTYNFAVNVYSGSELVKRESFTANVEGGKSVAGNATVLLTVILAIVFVVLLVVLIVLLARKPEKSEEFGESYY